MTLHRGAFKARGAGDSWSKAARSWLRQTSCERATAVAITLGARECIDALVELDAGVARDLHPFDLVPVDLGRQLGPQLSVLDRLLFGRDPSVPLPANDPTVCE